ncbi:hypothetical protein pb186bvf_005395 [Paramecium bursaria]
MLPKEFRVQIIFNNDLINEIDGERPPQAQIDSHQALFSTNTIKLKASMFMEKRKPGRPPKQKEEKEEIPKEKQEKEKVDSITDDELQDVPLDDFDDDIEIENDFNMSSSGKEKKYTKRQMNSMGGFDQPLLQLPSKKRKDHISEEDIVRKNQKEQQRRDKLARQQEEQKQQTVDRILNEVGRKQRMRQVQEDKKLDSHVYRSLPAGDTIIKYRSTPEASYIQCPQYYNMEETLIQRYKYPIIYQRPQIKQRERCSVSGCTNTSRYKYNNLFSCSLQCYKLLQ